MFPLLDPEQPATGRRPLKYQPVAYENLGSVSPKVFFGIFAVWSFAYIPQLFLRASCDTFFGTGACTDTEYWSQLWFGFGFLWTTVNWLFLAYLGHREPEETKGDFIRKEVQFIAYGYFAALGTMTGVGCKTVGGNMLKEQFIPGVAGMIVILMLCSSVLRGGTMAAPQRNPLASLNPLKFPSTFALFFVFVMNLFWFFDISACSGAEKYLKGYDADTDNTAGFKTAARFFENSIFIQCIQLMFVMTYCDAYAIHRPYLALGLLQCLSAEVFVRVQQGALMPEEAVNEGAVMRLVMAVVLIYGILAQTKNKEDPPHGAL